MNERFLRRRIIEEYGPSPDGGAGDLGDPEDMSEAAEPDLDDDHDLDE